MIDPTAGGDAAASLLERRWFASVTAVRAMQAECEVLREVMELAEGSWQRARTQLLQLETLRDALGEQLADWDDQRHDAVRTPIGRAVRSAA